MVQPTGKSKMANNEQARAIQLHERYRTACANLPKEASLKRMNAEEKRLHNAFDSIDFDPRFNSVNWMFDCFQLVREIAHSYCWMTAYADEASMPNNERDFYVQYYADNCITRINSFRDKAALLVWAYYCPFNPHNRNEMLGYEQVLERLKQPVRFGMTISRQNVFVTQLEKLSEPHFKRIKAYRDRKIHRIEPKILMRKPEASDGLSYMVPLLTENEVKEFDKKLKKMYPDDRSRERIREGCYIRGVLYDRISVKDEYWHYPEVEKAARKCTCTCVDVAKSLSGILRRRAPLR